MFQLRCKVQAIYKYILAPYIQILSVFFNICKFYKKNICTYKSTFIKLKKMDEVIKLGYLAGATRFRRISDKLYIDGNKLYSDEKVLFKAICFSAYYALSVSKKPLTVLDLANIIAFLT